MGSAIAGDTIEEDIGEENLLNIVMVEEDIKKRRTS